MSSTSNTSPVSQNDVEQELATLSVTLDDVKAQEERGWPDIEPVHKAFAHEYVLNGYDHLSAAERVGIARSGGIRVRRKPLVSAYINWLQERKLKSDIITKDFVSARLEDLYDMAIGEIDIPLVTGAGESFYAKKFQGGLALQILQEQSKMNGITKPDENNGGNVTVNIDMGFALGQKTLEGVTIDGSCEVCEND